MGIGGVTVLDGGFATQLTVHVGQHVDGDPLWSARFNATNPNAVVQTHLDFLQNGADIIMTNTYQASVDGYMEYLHLDEPHSIELIKDTVRLAQLARSKYLQDNNGDGNVANVANIPLIVGSIGPYGAHLHNGSEYTGSYADTTTKDTIKKWHRTRIDAIVEVGIDALAIETIPCLMEAEALCELLCDEYPDVKFWIAFQCKDGVHTARGEKFADASIHIWNYLKHRKALNNILAIGVNCLHPQFVTPLFKSLNGNLPKEYRLPLIVYPNSGEVYDVLNGWTGKEDCVPLENYVPEWIEIGAKYIGGCCRTYARDIARIKQTVQNYCS